MIIVTGATGNFGKAAIQSLLDKGVAGNDIAALVRDPNKASEWKEKGLQIRTGDYDDSAALKESLRGVNKLLLVSSSDVKSNRFLQHKNVIDAAKENGVQHIVYTGIDIKSFAETVIPHVAQVHIETADYLKQTGAAYTILNNTLYADLLPMLLGEQVLEKGIFFPAGNGKTPFALRADMAAAAAVVLTTTGHENKEYTITADTAYSFADIAGLLSEITGREIKYLNPDKESYINALTAAGVPKEGAGFLADFGEAVSRNEFDTHRSDLEQLLGRKPTALKEILKGIYQV